MKKRVAEATELLNKDANNDHDLLKAGLIPYIAIYPWKVDLDVQARTMFIREICTNTYNINCMHACTHACIQYIVQAQKALRKAGKAEDEEDGNDDDDREYKDGQREEDEQGERKRKGKGRGRPKKENEEKKDKGEKKDRRKDNVLKRPSASASSDNVLKRPSASASSSSKSKIPKVPPPAPPQDGHGDSPQTEKAG